MNKMILKTILSAVLTMSAGLILAAAPKSEAQFDKLVKNYTLNPDGSQELRVQKQLTIYTHAAMNSLYGETFIVYDPSYQELKINESYTRQADGTIVRTPENAFVEVLPSAAADAPAYNGLREMVVVHTGLELGATIFLDYTLVTKAGVVPALDIFEEVEELSPIRNYILSISVPEGTPLHYGMINGKSSPSVKVSDGMKTVTWTLKNVKPRPRSLAVSVQAGNVQAITATTYSSAQEFAGVLASQLYSADDPAVTARIEEMNAGRSDRRSIVDKIHEYVSEGLADCRLAFARTGFKVRPAAEVIGSAYATDAERTLLASAMLNAVGVSSEVLLALPAAEDRLSTGYASLVNILATGFVNASDDATADISAYLDIVGMDGQDVEVASPVHAEETETSMDVTADSSKMIADGIYAFSLPSNSSWLKRVYASTAANTVRQVNLLLPYKADETHRYVLEVKDGLRPLAIPEPVEISNPVGSLKVEVAESGTRIDMTYRLIINEQLVTPAMYPHYYQLMSEWHELYSTPLVFNAE